MPRFRSTRGGGAVSFEEALLRGLAPDGGLYVPEPIPQIHFPRILSESNFQAQSAAVLEPWIGEEIPSAEIAAIAHEALDFPVPLTALGGRGWDGVHVLELFHGPTMSFKDFGARMMARWVGRFLKERDVDVTILVATSGDTGSAVADGFAGQERIRVVLLYPKGMVSPVQERQIIAKRKGVRALAVEGDFDDCQRMVKEAFVDEQLSDAHLSSANSINIGRLLPQMLYYVRAVSRLESNDVLFCVPSGNLGNLTGGVLAHLSGLPVRGFVAAHNANDYFPRFLSGLEGSSGPTIRTHSNAMDVGVPSNFERLKGLLPEDEMRALIRGARISDVDTLDSMRRVHEETGYLADPHTAVGLEAVRRLRKRGEAHSPVVVLSTADPAKFPETVQEALGFEPDTPPRLAELWEREVAVETVAPTMEALRDKLLAWR